MENERSREDFLMRTNDKLMSLVGKDTLQPKVALKYSLQDTKVSPEKGEISRLPLRTQDSVFFCEQVEELCFCSWLVSVGELQAFIDVCSLTYITLDNVAICLTEFN